jgi:uncharacterized membrane protein
MRRLVVALVTAVLSVAWLGAPSARAEGVADTVTVKLEPTASSIRLGESLDLRITVTNHGVGPSPLLVVHLDVTDPGRSTSVDPEDWTATLTKRVGTVAAGDSATVHWKVHPVSSGTFATYAVALSQGVTDAATSNVLYVAVADKRPLNPGGILAVALGMPGLVGALLLLQLRLSRRTR